MNLDAMPEINNAAPAPVSLREAFWYWLKLGFISFGGPAGQIAIMHHDLVEKHRWISERRFLHALNYCMLLPGPEAQQLAVYIGWLMHRTPGGIIAGSLFVLPSFFLLVALSWIYVTYGSVPVVAGILYGIKPAVTAIVLFAAYRIGSRALKNATLWMMALAAFIAIFAFRVPFPYIVLTAGVVGFLGSRLAPDKFAMGGSHGSTGNSNGMALIDDDTPTPEHARFSWPRLLRVVATGCALWAAVMALLIAQEGWGGTLPTMARFFTNAALLTFGGAYAVLPYVFQGAVEHYHWLTALQMIDGLALGETTPGPLIMVVTYVGFIGGWDKAMFGPDAQFVAAAAAAAVTTFFTFLPSYVFIFMGGPLIETTHGDLKFTAPLTGITAAVVGVVINLAVFFAYHVLWTKGLGGPFDLYSAVLGLAAAVALLRYKVGVIPVILACGAAGMIYRLVFG